VRSSSFTNQIFPKLINQSTEETDSFFGTYSNKRVLISRELGNSSLIHFRLQTKKDIFEILKKNPKFFNFEEGTTTLLLMLLPAFGFQTWIYQI
jgi:hypothetical protein